MEIEQPVVSSEWLAQHIDDPQIVILNATLPKVTTVEEDVITHQIPGTRKFDFEIFKDSEDERPNTMPSPEKFTLEARKLGIKHKSVIIIYDEHGVYSSPRAWWMFHSMGHDRVAILDGGFPDWLEKGNKIESKAGYSGEPGNFFATFQRSAFVDKLEILNSINNPDLLVADARSPERFDGSTPEPRAEMRSGHIPGSVNIHYSSLLDGNKIRSNDELTEIFQNKIEGKEQLIFSCGSGITACILGICAKKIGINNFSVYDGSWSEWGLNSELPIE